MRSGFGCGVGLVDLLELPVDQVEVRFERDDTGLLGKLVQAAFSGFELYAGHFELLFQLLLGRAGRVDPLVHFPGDEFLQECIDDVTGKRRVGGTEGEGDESRIAFGLDFEALGEFLFHALLELQAGKSRICFLLPASQGNP